MVERKNTLPCSFDPNGPHLSEYEIHEWLGLDLGLLEHEVLLVQTDAVKKQVYVKLREYCKLSEILTVTKGEKSIRHGNGEITTVRIEEAGVGVKRVR
jgi:hypothetical protein